MQKKLQQLKDVLSSKYFIEEKHDDILTISPSKNSLPFAIIICDKDLNDELCLSFAADFHDPVEAANLTITIMHTSKVIIYESFYYDKMNNIHWGDQAFEMYEVEGSNLIDIVEPVSNLRH